MGYKAFTEHNIGYYFVDRMYMVESIETNEKNYIFWTKNDSIALSTVKGEKMLRRKSKYSCVLWET